MYSVGVRHTMTAGLLHGALLLAVLGAVLGAASGRLVKGLPIGALAGIGGALSYYGLILVMDSRTYGTAISGAWMTMWLLLATLEGRWLRAPDRRPWSGSLLWGRPSGEERNYLVQFAAWAFAWAPGVLALTWGNRVSASAQT